MCACCMLTAALNLQLNCLEPWVPLFPGVNYIDEGSSSVVPVFIFDLPYPGE